MNLMKSHSALRQHGGFYYYHIEINNKTGNKSEQNLTKIKWKHFGYWILKQNKLMTQKLTKLL